MTVIKFIVFIAILIVLVACTTNSNKDVVDSKQIGIRPLQTTTTPVPTIPPTNLPDPVPVVLATAISLPSATPTLQPTATNLPASTATSMPTMEPSTSPTVVPVPPSIDAPITTNVDDVYQGLVGQWAWQSSYYYFVPEGGPNIETPATTGEEVTLDFGADRILREYVNGALVREASYSVEQAGAEWLLYIDGAMSWMELSDQDLMISTAPVDGPMSFYKRAEAATQINGVVASSLEEINRLLIGHWQWTASHSYFLGEEQPRIDTPASSGEQRYITFGEDGIAREYLNGELLREGAYSVEQAVDAWALYIGQEIATIKIAENELMIDTTPLDGPLSFYARVETMT